MTLALTRQPSLSLVNCEVTHVSRQPIDIQLVIQQHELYCQALQQIGVEVERLAPLEAYPDSVFIEDNAIVLDEVVVLTSMGTASRQGEVASLRSVLSRSRRLVEILPPAKIEGGDVLRVDKHLFVGVSSLTNLLGVEALREIVEPLGYDVTTVSVHHCLHLKTACTALDDETLLVNPAWLDVELFKKFRLLLVSFTEPFGANVLRVPQGILASAAFPRTLDLIRTAGQSVTQVDISEFSKAEAGVTCLSLVVD